MFVVSVLDLCCVSKLLIFHWFYSCLLAVTVSVTVVTVFVFLIIVKTRHWFYKLCWPSRFLAVTVFGASVTVFDF